MTPKKNKMIKLAKEMTDGYLRYKPNMPEREKESVSIFDWEIDFEANEDWPLWEMEMIEYQMGKKIK
jgi:serine protease inhibitor